MCNVEINITTLISKQTFCSLGSTLLCQLILSVFFPFQDQHASHFTHIAALQSELVAIDGEGRLCQWRWDAALPYHSNEKDGEYVIRHPRAVELGVSKERVVLVDACNVRCSLATDTGKVGCVLECSSLLP